MCTISISFNKDPWYNRVTKTFWINFGVYMKRTKGLLRLLCAIIDTMIVSIPVLYVMIAIFRVSDSQAELLLKLLLAVYGVLFMEYMNGATLAKGIGRIRVTSTGGTKPTLAEYGMRELVKSLYFVPWIGWLLCLISTIMLFIGSGRTIHDRIAGTAVVYVWDKSLDMQK